ncbi:MAG: carbohydrate-binding protein [Actinomycetia bacterium]|nr:carbohydrate-binding protein [Actinomycetes bacterium]
MGSGGGSRPGRPLGVLCVLAFAAVGCVPLPARLPAQTPRPLGVTAPASPAGNAAPLALASFGVTLVPGRQEATLTWRYAPDSAPARVLHLDLYSVVRGVSYRSASTIIGQTVEPHTYTIPLPAGSWSVRATPENAWGFGPGSTGTVTVTNPCRAADLCARVSTSAAPVPVRLAAQGFLLGVTDGAGQLLNPTKVAQLAPRQWRFSGATSNAAAAGLGVSRMQILSDLWNSATAPGHSGYAQTPWSDWNAWQTFVQGTVRLAEQQGWAPNYWDVWNEPNGTCCPRFSPADQATVTVGRWMQTYALAWQAIKSVDPNAQVVGPSLSALQWAPGAPAEFDLDTFLSYSAAHNVRWDAVSWHENTSAPSPGDVFSSISNVDRHVAMAKAVMARHPGTVAKNRILINEYGPSDTHMLAGWAVGFFRAFEDDGVSQANLACWSEAECTTQLDGLLTPAGATTAVWWAHRLYADLGGATRMAVASSAPWQLDGLATRNDRSRTVRALLGRHWSCNQRANAWCANNTYIGGASVAVTIDWPYGSAPVHLVASRLAAGTGAVVTPPVLRSVVVIPKAGTLTLTVPGVSDGDAISIVARRA